MQELYRRVKAIEIWQCIQHTQWKRLQNLVARHLQVLQSLCAGAAVVPHVQTKQIYRIYDNKYSYTINPNMREFNISCYALLGENSLTVVLVNS